MTDPTAQLKQLLQASKAETQRTPFLDIQAGALQNALDAYAQHTAALEALAKARPAKLKQLEEEVETLKAQIAATPK
jgi:hypothetical protein